MKKSKVERTRFNIIRASKSLFKEISIHKITMNEIANAAKISRRTLYTHFKSKNEIRHYVVEEEVSIINNKLNQIRLSNLKPERKLKLYILTRFNVVDKLVRNNKYIRYDFIFNRLSVEHLRRSIDKNELKIIEEIISKGVAEGIFNIPEPKDFSLTFLTMIKSLEQPFIIVGNRARNYTTILQYVDLLFNGILKSK